MDYTKQNLRKKHLKLRDKLSQSEIKGYGRSIVKEIATIVDWTSVVKLLSYRPINSEVDTEYAEQSILKINPDIQITYVDADPTALPPAGEYDVIFIPCLAADKTRHRLGSGGGWYDRFLKTQSTAKTIGLVYGFSIEENLPIELHDVALDVIISAE